MLKLATEKLHLEYETSAETNGTGVRVHLSGHNGIEWQRILSTTSSTTPTLLLPQSGNHLFVAYSFDIYALDAHTGDILWHYECDEPIWNSYLLDDENLLVHLELSVVRLHVDGSERWRFQHHEIITRVALQASYLLIQDFDEQHFALSMELGTLLAEPL